MSSRSRFAGSRHKRFRRRRSLPRPARLHLESLELRQLLAVAPLADTFALHSLPGAKQVIYLDFDGHTTTGTQWNSSYSDGAPIVTPAWTLDADAQFNSSELDRIQNIWQRVAEDFIPFEVDVTTEDPGSDALRHWGSGDDRWGIRVVLGGTAGGQNDWYPSSIAGVAYLGSFLWTTDTPAFVFSTGESWTANTISHEVGHTLGLSHDGTFADEYYGGHGNGPTGWFPIMGSGSRSLSQWSRGEYAEANNSEDDLAIITSGTNGFGYRPDDHGNSPATSTQLIPSGATLTAQGIIERNNDLDFFRIDLAQTTQVALQFDPTERGANLDILARLHDAAGNVVASSNPYGTIGATINALLGAGTYYISVDGVGQGNPADGYGDYGSLGQYSIAGSLTSTAAAQVIGQYLFYNNSAYDDNDPSATAADDAAIAPDKVALLPGQTASFDHVSGFNRGLNGLMIDVAGLKSSVLSSADFEFQVGNNSKLQFWRELEVAPQVSIRPGAGAGGSDRISLIWPDFAIRNIWLQVTMRANARTGLAAPYVFYFGSASGDTNQGSDLFGFANAADQLVIRANPTLGLTWAGLDNPLDINRDKRVNATDRLIIRSNPLIGFNRLQIIEPPGLGSGGGAQPAVVASIDGVTASKTSSSASRWDVSLRARDGVFETLGSVDDGERDHLFHWRRRPLTRFAGGCLQREAGHA